MDNLTSWDLESHSFIILFKEHISLSTVNMVRLWNLNSEFEILFEGPSSVFLWTQNYIFVQCSKSSNSSNIPLFKWGKDKTKLAHVCSNVTMYINNLSLLLKKKKRKNKWKVLIKSLKFSALQKGLTEYTK